MTPRIKICGITLADDAARASASGADFIGINFWIKSKRHVPASRAALLAAAAHAAGDAKVVGVFVDASAATIAEIVHDVALDVIQLHGDESPDDVVEIATLTKRPVWKAFPATSPELADLERYAVAAVLLDTPTPDRGGSGATFDWTLARTIRHRYPGRLLVLAGGLRPDNVAAAIAAAGSPWAIDVASGVETAPGIKDAAKISQLVAAVRLVP
ncbi:MAG: phosphoribosylanthranilate isomerase [Kofleriaceae bacterium]